MGNEIWEKTEEAHSPLTQYFLWQPIRPHSQPFDRMLRLRPHLPRIYTTTPHIMNQSFYREGGRVGCLFLTSWYTHRSSWDHSIFGWEVPWFLTFGFDNTPELYEYENHYATSNMVCFLENRRDEPINKSHQSKSINDGNLTLRHCFHNSFEVGSINPRRFSERISDLKSCVVRTESHKRKLLRDEGTP